LVIDKISAPSKAVCTLQGQVLHYLEKDTMLAGDSLENSFKKREVLRKSFSDLQKEYINKNHEIKGFWTQRLMRQATMHVINKSPFS
jgi:hypothetical protein